MLIKSTNDTPTEKGAGTVWFTDGRKLTRRERAVFHGSLKDWPFWQILTATLVLVTFVLALVVWVALAAIRFSPLDRDARTVLNITMAIAATMVILLVPGLLVMLPLRRKSSIEALRRGDWQNRGFIHESQPMYRLVQPLMSDANLRDAAFVDRLGHFFTASVSTDYKLRYGSFDRNVANRYEVFCRLVDELLQAARVVAGNDVHFERDMQIWRADMIKQANKKLQQARSSAQAEVLRLQSVIDAVQTKLPEQSEIRE